MIKCYIFGGIGNQMFQYLSGVYLSKKNDIDIVFDYNLIDSFKTKHHTKRLYEIFDLENIKFIKKKKTNSLKSDKLLKIYFNILYFLKYKINFISDHNFLKQKLNIKKNYFMFGYFQNIQNLNKNIIDVENFFSFKKNYFKSKLYKKINTYKNSVCLHIRRGDYLTPKYKKKYNILNDEYYLRAINLFLKKKKKIHLFIFSDDEKYAKNFCDKIQNKHELSYTLIKKNSSDQDLFLMSCCKNFIIANSTFSWWAAIISKNKNKIIMTPQDWYKNKNDNKNNKLNFKQWIKL